MKNKVKKQVFVEIVVCNICDKEIENPPFNKARIEIVRGLFKTSDFDAHETCINKVVREAFKEYI